MLSTGSKATIGAGVFMLACAIGLAFSSSSVLWKSFYFIREHLFIIGLLILILKYIEDSWQIALIYGLMFYKIELVLFNIFLAFAPQDEWLQLNKGSTIAEWLIFSIWFIIFVCLLLKKRL